ncbi:MAG: hypothetical protein JEZ11_25370 [Desulfobacterales bacterium]|nr:hypothetical protein [Desulfobacterales bacterium]
MESSQTTHDPVDRPEGQVETDRPVRGKTRRIAVLFTDVVGSTRYFKSRGDTAGRKMLQDHVELASEPIRQEKGILVKTIGDSVMAYFDQAIQAVRAAAGIQKAFREFNRKQALDDRIHVRIGIHYGQGIVEEKDIFGNVVNLAAKVMPLVGGDQIFVTDTVHAAMGRDCPFPVEWIDGGRQGTALAGIALYNLIWHKEAATTTAQGTFVQFKLCPALADKGFADLWVRFMGMRQHIWADRVLHEAVQGPSALVALGSVADAVELAGKVLVHFQKGMRRNDSPPLIPVQILIDHGPYRRDQPLTLKTVGIDWTELEPGKIHLSAAAAGAAAGKQAFPLQPVGEEGAGSAVQVLITTLTHGKDHSARFLYQGWPAGGNFLPCFYCGDRRHRAANCPSKAGDSRPVALYSMGNQPLGNINRAFFSWLTADPPVEMALLEKNQEESPALTAFKCYCDLGFHFQLRFFMLLWGTAEEDWEKVRKTARGGSRGGPVWLALDCLRTGNLTQAEYLIDGAMDRCGADYRAHCTLGLIHVEKGNTAKAEMAFTRALDMTKTEPEQIFVSLMLFRLLEVAGESIRAGKAVRRLLARHPQCPDLQFLAIKYKFRDGGLDRKALPELVELIRSHRRFYLHAMMDPDLAPAWHRIQPELARLLTQAGETMKKLLPVAEAEVSRFQEIFGETDTEVARERSLRVHAEELGQGGSYFGFLDAADTARSLIDRVQRTIQSRKRGVGRTLMDLEQRCTGLVKQARDFADSKAMGRILTDLGTAYAEVVEMKEMLRADQPEIFVTIFSRADDLSKRLDVVARTIKRMVDRREIRRFLMSFVNKSLIFQSINLLIGVVFFPLVNHYLNFVLPQLRLSDLSLISYQKAFLFMGGVTGILVALLRTAKSIYPR